MSSEQELEALIENFDPNDPASVAALEKAIGGDDEATATSEAGDGEQGEVEGDGAGGETPPAETPEQKDEKPAEPAPGATSDAKPESAEQPEGVMAKDGKHIIPFSVLERERQARIRAEQMAEDQKQLIEQLQSGAKPGSAASGGAAMLSEEELAELESDLPGVAKAIRAQQATIQALQDQVKSVRTSQEVQEKSAEEAQADEEQAAIAASPTLSKLQELAFTESAKPEDVDRWNRVTGIYATLRDDPLFANLSTPELVAKAEATVNTLLGPMAGITQPPAPKPTPQPAKKPEDLSKAAEEKLKASTPEVPQSLSEFPGGTPPAQSSLENIEQASNADLDRMFEGLTAEQIERKLATFGL